MVIRDAGPRRALAEAYGRVRAHRFNPALRLNLVETLLDAGQPRRTYRHIRRVLANAPPDWGGLSRLGEILFRMGEHAAAEQTFARAQSLGVLAARSHRTHAALLHKRGDTSGAARMLALSALMVPVAPPRRQTPGRTQALRIRCFDNSRYQMHRSRRTGL